MTLPDKQASVFGLCEDMIDGEHTYQVVLDLKHHPETLTRGFLDAAQTAQTNYANSVASQAEGSKAVTVADSNGKAFIGAARKALTPYLGEAWSADWQSAGFPNRSTGIPKKQDERFALLLALQTYLTDHPTYENADPKVNVTAARAGALYAALDSARQGFNALQAQTLDLKVTRDTKMDELRDEMRGLIGELTDVLAEDDPKWLAFGLPLPGANHVPERPELLVLLAGGPGVVHADWADTPRAERYHIEILIVGVDTEFRRVLTREESDAALTGLPSGQTVKVRVLAVNAAGGSVPSDVVQIVVA